MSIFGTYIEESVDNSKHIKQLNSLLVQVMAHMLKYLKQPNKQTTSWLTSIYYGVKYVEDHRKEVNKNVVQAVGDPNNLDAIYDKAIDKAAYDTKMSKSIFPYPRDAEWTFEYLTSRDTIDSFVRKNAYNNDMKRYFGQI